MSESGDLFATYQQAHDFNVYELAHRWADVSRHPHPTVGSDGEGVLVPSTPVTELDQVATMAALAGWLTSWLPIHLHRALLAGATVAEVAVAAGLNPFEVSVRWREWSDGQRHVLRQLPGLLDDTPDFDRVAAILAAEPTETYFPRVPESYRTPAGEDLVDELPNDCCTCRDVACDQTLDDGCQPGCECGCGVLLAQAGEDLVDEPRCESCGEPKTLLAAGAVPYWQLPVAAMREARLASDIVTPAGQLLALAGEVVLGGAGTADVTSVAADHEPEVDNWPDDDEPGLLPGHYDEPGLQALVDQGEAILDNLTIGHQDPEVARRRLLAMYAGNPVIDGAAAELRRWGCQTSPQAEECLRRMPLWRQLTDRERAAVLARFQSPPDVVEDVVLVEYIDENGLPAVEHPA